MFKLAISDRLSRSAKWPRVGRLPSGCFPQCRWLPMSGAVVLLVMRERPGLAATCCGQHDPIRDTQAVMPAYRDPPPVHIQDPARVAQSSVETESLFPRHKSNATLARPNYRSAAPVDTDLSVEAGNVVPDGVA